MIDIQVLSHSILLVLPLDCILVLPQAVDSIVPRLPVVFSQYVGDGALLAGDVVLYPRPRVGGALQPRLAGPAPLRAKLFELFDYSNSKDRIVVFGILIRSIFKTRIVFELFE